MMRFAMAIRARFWPAVCAITVGLIAVATGQLDAQEPNRAALVVRLGDDHVRSECVDFAEDTISGEELLQRAGVKVVGDTAALGTLVCSIDGVGCPADNCFCSCKGDPCEYWSYWHWRDGEWQYATTGAAVYRVGDGAIEGWSWGPGSVTEAIAPPTPDLAEICGDVVVPVSPGESSAATSVAQPSAPEAGDGRGASIVSYAFFGIVLLSLGGVLLWRQRKVS